MSYKDIIKQKEFPNSYPSDVVDVIEAMSFTGKPQIVGSMSYRSQQYAGDYDMIEKVMYKAPSDKQAVDMIVIRFQNIIKNLLNKQNIFIGDIKCGEVKEWIVIPQAVKIQSGKVVNYDKNVIVKKLEELYAKSVISQEEYDKALSLAKDTLTPLEFIALKKEVKYAVVRWKPIDVLNGFVILRKNRRYTLQEGVSSPSLTKIDCISYVENSRFTDFSLIYLFYNNGKALNPMFGDISPEEEKQLYIDGLKADILYYVSKENYFKALKRVFALGRVLNKKGIIELLNPLMNGDLGRLYSITSDIGTILYLLENYQNLPEEKIQYEIDMFKKRFANIYSVDKYDFSKDKYLSFIFDSETPLKSSAGRNIIKRNMESLEEYVNNVLKEETKAELKRLGMKNFFPKWTTI